MKGRHITIDAQGCANLDSKQFLLDFINKLVVLIDMNILLEPQIVEGAEHLPGLTCFCIIETSHIAIHTFTDKKSLSADVYSCKDFDANVVFKYFEKKFAIKEMTTNNIERFV